MSDFFVSECRKNENRFDHFSEEREHMIQNYPMKVTDGSLQDIYLF